MSFLTRRNVGKMQIITGLIILIVTLVSSILIFNDSFSNLTSSFKHITESWSYYANTSFTKNNIPAYDAFPHDISFLVVAGAELRIVLYVLGAGTAILIVLSIILILQGLANISRK